MRCYHKEGQFFFRHRLQVWDSEGLWEGVSLGQRFCSLDCHGEALQPGPLGGVPGRGVWEAGLVMRRDGRAAQEPI